MVGGGVGGMLAIGEGDFWGEMGCAGDAGESGVRTS